VAEHWTENLNIEGSNPAPDSGPWEQGKSQKMSTIKYQIG